MRKSAKNFMAFALAASMVASTFAPATAVQAAGKKTVYLVTQKEDNNGGVYKYAYNAKGLLTKEVFTNSYKNKNLESKSSATTKYTYNKKDRISSVVYDANYTDVSYYTDKYGDRRPRIKDQKVSTTTTYKDNAKVEYTYDKKGNVIQTKETSYGVKIPENNVDTSTNNRTYNIPRRFQEDANGKYIKSDRSYYKVNDYIYVYVKSDNDNASIYTGDDYYLDSTKFNLDVLSDDDLKSVNDSLAKEKKYTVVTGTGVNDVKVPITTTKNYTYTDNGNGSITETEVIEKQSFDSSKSTADSLAYITTKTTTTTKTVKKEITTNYTYDKKKRVKKAVAETIETTTTTGNRKVTNNVGTSEQKDDPAYDYTETVTEISRKTDTYTYNKKGKAVKVVTLDEPEVKDETVINRKYPEISYINNEEKVETREETKSVVIENGNKTTTTTNPKKNNDGSVTSVTTTKTSAYPANTVTYTTTFKYDKKGNLKSSKGKTSKTNRVNTYTIVEGEEKIVYSQIPGKKYNETTGKTEEAMVDDYEAPVYTTKVYTSTSSSSKDVELKKNTARLAKAVAVYKSLDEGESKSSYGVSRVTFKVKGKKLAKKAASSADKQQWIIQNGFFNGDEGLNTRSFEIENVDADSGNQYFDGLSGYSSYDD